MPHGAFRHEQVLGVYLRNAVDHLIMEWLSDAFSTIFACHEFACMLSCHCRQMSEPGYLH